MDRLRAALVLLVDEARPLRERLERLCPAVGRARVPYLGPAVITPILHVTYPEMYGVLNETLVRSLKRLGLGPRHPSTRPLAD